MAVLSKKPTSKKLEKESILTKKSSIKIKEVKDRNKLCEGRSYGMGFAMLNRVGKDSYETVQPISPCKDYLAEVITTELTGIGTAGCGLVYPEKLGIYNKTCAYMVILMQKSKSGGYYQHSSLETDTNKLHENHKNIVILLNNYEEKLGFKTKTSIEEANDDMFLVTLPIEWTQSTQAISMYTLLMRVALTYDGKEDIDTFLDKCSKDAKNIDAYLIKSAIPKFKKVLEKPSLLEPVASHIEAVKKSVNKNNMSSWCPHNNGIIACVY